MMRLRRIIAPTVEPLSLLEAAQQLRLCDSQEEAEALPDKSLIEGLITTAREAVESYTNRQICVATYELVGELLTEQVTLPKAPFVEVVQVEYWTGLETVTLPDTAYAEEIGTEPSVLHINLPASQVSKLNGAKITFKAGYEDTTDETGNTVSTIPASVKQAMKLLVTHYYLNREAVMVGTTSTIGTELPLGVQYLLNPLRVYA